VKPAEIDFRAGFIFGQYLKIIGGRKMPGLEGLCHSCGTHYHGWALNNPLNQSCLKCGNTLEIHMDGNCKLATIDSPDTDGLANNLDEEIWENMCDKKLLFQFSSN
jgi:hypothetical protein